MVGFGTVSTTFAGKNIKGLYNPYETAVVQMCLASMLMS